MCVYNNIAAVDMATRFMNLLVRCYLVKSKCMDSYIVCVSERMHSGKSTLASECMHACIVYMCGYPNVLMCVLVCSVLCMCVTGMYVVFISGFYFWGGGGGIYIYMYKFR